MSVEHGRIPDLELGERLRLARETAKVTQAEAGKIIEAARTTVVAIEQGQRKIRMDELQKLASAYGTNVNALMRREAVHLDLVPQFRRHFDSGDAEIESASRLLNQLVAAELELENVLGVTRPKTLPPERPILPGDITTQAEHDAAELRRWLGIGQGPIQDLLGLLESQLGVRIYLRPLPAKISGLFAYDEVAGACMLFNSNHPAERNAQTGGHEAGHLISNRREPEAVLLSSRHQSRGEKYANAFGRALLTPAIAVRQKFSELTSGQSHLTRRHVILLAAEFGVSREAMVRRLEELGLVRQGTWDWFVENGGISNEQVREVLGIEPLELAQNVRSFGPVPQRLALLAREASKRALYSEGQLAQILGLDRHEVRAVLDGLDEEVSEADEFSQIVR